MFCVDCSADISMNFFRLILLFLLTTCVYANIPSEQPTLFCVIKTFGKNLATRAVTIHQTWARHCDKHVFLTATNLSQWNDIALPILNLFDVGDNYLELSIKVFDALNSIIQKPMNFDWLLMADDDTYVIMENLRPLLSRTSEALAFGHLFKPNNGAPGHFSGGAGYVINKIALQRMLPNLQTTCAEWYVPGMEDVYVSRCLQHLNVTLNGAVDGRHHQFYPLDFLTLYRMDIPKWFADYNALKAYAEFDCCSSKSISFHYVTRESMNLIEWTRYLRHDS